MLQVSSGPALIAIPDVLGLDEQSATRELGSTGFEVAVVYEPTQDPAQHGIVLSQDRQGGTHAEKGSLVTITVARLSS